MNLLLVHAQVLRVDKHADLVLYSCIAEHVQAAKASCDLSKGKDLSKDSEIDDARHTFSKASIANGRHVDFSEASNRKPRLCTAIQDNHRDSGFISASTADAAYFSSEESAAQGRF